MLGLIDTEKYPFKKNYLPTSEAGCIIMTSPDIILVGMPTLDLPQRYLVSIIKQLGGIRSQNSEEYTPPLNKRNPSVNDFLVSNGWQRPSKKEKNILQRCKWLKTAGARLLLKK